MNIEAASKKDKGKLRQYERLLLSYADFKHANLVSKYIIGKKLHEQQSKEPGFVLEALNCSMIVSYCRPFSNNDKRAANKVPPLPDNFIDVLNAEEKEIHKIVINDRNRVLAHSDSEALNVLPVVWKSNDDSETVAPIKNWGLAPLTKEATILFSSAAEKMFKEVIMKRIALEPDVKKFLMVVNTEQMSKLLGGEEIS